MAAKKCSNPSEAYPMNGGNGLYSYTNNSSFQRGVTDAAKLLINEAIAEKLDIKNFSVSNTFRIADLGCSVGPNTFFAVQNIVEAVKLKYHGQELSTGTPEFQVFFNDHTLNDFNTLFASLPAEKQYYAAGVPGSFYSRFFPCASLHLVHSSYAIQWLSKVPKEVIDKSSLAWNKGRIHYSNAGDEVVKAFSTQHAMDVECFLHARAQEVVCGGLMVIIVPAHPNGIPHCESTPNITFNIFGSCLMDMAKRGVIDEDRVDSFNIPLYNTSPQELEEAIQQNGCFSIERMESLPQVTAPDTRLSAQMGSLHMRACTEGLLKEQFGHEIIDELFDLYCEELEEASSNFKLGKGISLFVLLKRRASDR